MRFLSQFLSNRFPFKKKIMVGLILTSCDVKNDIRKTAVTHALVTLKNPITSKVILDIICKGLIHKSDTVNNKNG